MAFTRPCRSRFGNITTIGLAGVAIAGLSWASFTLLVAPTPAPLIPAALEAGALRHALVHCGLGPAELAAASVAPAAVTPLVARARQHMEENPGAFTNAANSYISAAGTVDRLEDLVRSGRATQEQVSALASARTSLSSASGSRDTAANGLFQAAAAGLTEAQRAALLTIRTNRAFEVPMQYKLTARTPEQWVALREATANQRIAAARGEAPDTACHQLVLDCNAENATASAASALSSNLPAVSESWRNAIE